VAAPEEAAPAPRPDASRRPRTAVHENNVTSPPSVERVPPPALVTEATPPGQTEQTAQLTSSGFRRRDLTDEYALACCLHDISIEIKLDAVKDTSAKLLAAGKDRRDKTELTHPVLELLAKRDDLAGLPARKESECKLEEKSARLMECFARE